MLTALETAMKSVTTDWKAAKRQADRDNRVRRQDLERMRQARKYEWNLKDAAYHVMEQAYLRASANNTLPANARQIMYKARPMVLDLMNGKCWKNSSYFTQHLLPDYMEEYPTKTAGWDVVFDARGHLREPHAGDDTDLGTLEVRRYIHDWRHDFSEGVEDIEAVRWRVPTSGPKNRYNFVLFVEKEGFNSLFSRVQLAERLDLAIMSTKGMSVTAARQLIEELSSHKVTILVLHDFDKAGFSILSTLGTDTRRYTFGRAPNVVDLGLRLKDVQEMGLESEPVDYVGRVNPQKNLRQSGASSDECDFLVTGHSFNYGWQGQRVEINAMSSDQLVGWLEGKLESVGVKKVVPGREVLEKAYRRAVRRAAIQKAVDKAIEDYKEANTDIPDDLEKQVQEMIDGTTQPWDGAIWQLARERAEDATEA